MTTSWNNTRKTVPISEYDKFKHKFDNFRQIDLEQFTNVDGMTNFYDIKDNVVGKVDDEMEILDQLDKQETTCNNMNNLNNTASGNSTNSNVTTPPIGSFAWLTDSIGISNINIPSNPNKNQGFTPVGDSYKPTNRGYLAELFNGGGGGRPGGVMSGISEIRKRYGDNLREQTGMNKMMDYVNSMNSYVNNQVNEIHSTTNKSQCVNKKNVSKDSNTIVNELSKLFVLPAIFWMTYNIFYISVYQNVNCYRADLPDVWDYFMSFDEKMGGNSFFSSFPRYIFEFAIYAPHYMNQCIRKIICSIPHIDVYAAVYFIVILGIIITINGPTETHSLMADSMQLNDTQLTGIAFIITLIAGIQYWYANWYNNFIFKFVGGTLIWFLVIVIMMVINLLFISIMFPMGIFIITFLIYIYTNWSIIFFDHSGDNLFISILNIISKISKVPATIRNIHSYIYKVIYDNEKKGYKLQHIITKYIFYFIYEISIIIIMCGSISNFAREISDDRLMKSFIYSYGFLILLVLMFSFARYSYDPPIPSNDMTIIEKIFTKFISFFLTGSMEYMNDFYRHTELLDCEVHRNGNKDEYKECDVKILDDRMNKNFIKNIKEKFNDTVNNIKNEVPKNLEKTIETNVTTATNAINPNNMFSMISDKLNQTNLNQNNMIPNNMIPNNMNQIPMIPNSVKLDIDQNNMNNTGKID